LHSDLYKDIQSVPGPEKMQLDLILLILIVVKFPWIKHNWRCFDYFLSYMSSGFKKQMRWMFYPFYGFIAKMNSVEVFLREFSMNTQSDIPA